MRHTRPPAAHDVAVPAHDRAGSDNQPHRGQPVGWQRPGQQGQPRPVRPRQTRMSARPLALGDSELMAQHKDLGVLPPRLPPRQAQHRHRTGHDQENQLQAHRPKIIPSPDGPGPARPAPERGTRPTAICRASAQVGQVFGTHRSPTTSPAWPVTAARRRPQPGRSGCCPPRTPAPPRAATAGAEDAPATGTKAARTWTPRPGPSPYPARPQSPARTRSPGGITSRRSAGGNRSLATRPHPPPNLAPAAGPGCPPRSPNGSWASRTS